MGWSVMGILHFMNKMPIDWYSKKWATMETATYGSKFIAACTCIDQVLDLRLTLHYLSVPIHDVSYIFGDNKSIVQSATQPHAKHHKWHNALSFHWAWEAIVSKNIIMTHMPGADNPADILSKHWAYQVVYLILKPLLFFLGNTADLIQEGWFNMTTPSLDIPYGIICFAFFKRPRDDGEWQDHTASCTYVHVLSLCDLYPLLVTWRIQMRTFKRFFSHAVLLTTLAYT